jgi:uncharacterized cupredoxin-like copper-binding protein
MTTRHIAALPAALALCLLSACGSDDKESSSSSPQKLAVKVTQTGKKVTVEVPKSIKGGLTEVSLDNTGEKAPHSAQLIRIDGDHSAAEVIKVTGGDGGKIPSWVHGAGGIGTVAPGKTGTATVVLKPGNYYVQNDEGEPGPDNLAKLSVTGEGGGELPSTPATVTAKEYSFQASGLKAGSNRITFENGGKELHHLLAVPIKPGANLAAVKKFIASEGEGGGPPPVDFEKASSTSVLDGGTKEVTEIDLKKGKYAFVCFIQDRAGGPPHAAKGMLQEQTID